MANQVNKIIEGLFITNYSSALDPNNIMENNIQTVINCTKTNDKVNLNIDYLQIPIDDPPSYSDIQFLNTNFMDIFLFIDKSLFNRRNVLVHCVMGSQRSATVIAIYLMVKFGLKYPDAIAYIKEKRPICFWGKVNYLESLKHIENVNNDK